jgi:hypothetical protein
MMIIFTKPVHTKGRRLYRAYTQGVGTLGDHIKVMPHKRCACVCNISPLSDICTANVFPGLWFQYLFSLLLSYNSYKEDIL